MSSSKPKKSETPSPQSPVQPLAAVGATAGGPLALPALSRFQKFEMRRVHRTQLKNAPYNPRKIDKRAREKLTKNLSTVGLVEAPTWNEDTGNIVSGHRRVEILDTLEADTHGQDYLLDVCVVQLSLKTERQQNAFMNNPAAQGDYDTTLLADLLKDDGFDHAAAGFDRLDVQMMYSSDEELGAIFKPDPVTEHVFAELAAVTAASKAQSEPGLPPVAVAPVAAVDGEDPGPGGDSGDANAPPVPGAPRRSDVVKEFMKGQDAGADTETYAVVTFKTRREREIFMSAMGNDPHTRYCDGAHVFAKLGINPEGEEWAAMFEPSAMNA